MKAFFKLLLVFFTLFSGLSAHPSGAITLYGTPLSPYVRKVMSVLEHKKIEYVQDPTLPTSVLKTLGQQVPIGFEQTSPLGKIPAIQVQEGPLADSTAIVSYLEKKWPHNSVYPTSPYIAAKSVWFDQYAGSEMSEIFHKLFIEKVLKPKVFNISPDENVIEELTHKIPTILQYLEKSLTETKTHYLVSNELTMGDISVLHQFIGLQLANVTIDVESYPHLKTYLKRGMDHSAIQAVIKKL